ncbi:hypothetical protein BC937DRAFT_88776 [Endogone sp. FLAS-F59071]|nr:hypothetical protein BC937DRAFT_88776 [Endogone sp. FLAS-F59071]|eukprot:RUS18439.1 hypothetical protein BC937DRAFT_88776 [Endogone sp. FLAS-F59071]
MPSSWSPTMISLRSNSRGANHSNEVRCYSDLRPPASFAFDVALLPRNSISAKYEPTREARLYEICGVIGILKGFTSNYLVVISSCKHRGNISKKPVYVISKISCLELNYHNACRTLNQQQRKSFVESDGEGEGDNDSDSLDDNSANTDERSRSNSSLTTITPPEPADNAPSPRSSLIQQVNLSKFYAPQTSLVSSPSPKTSNSFLTKMKVSMGAKNPKVTEEPATIEDIDFVDSESVPVAAINSPKSTASVSSSARKFSLFGNVEKEAAAGADGTAGAAKAATAQMILEERALDQRMVRELNSLFSGDMFFFSYDLDLTNTFQRKYDNGTEVEKKPLWQQVDKRFFWNEKLAEDFIRLELHEWILPVSQGSLQIETCEIEGYTFDFILISRRSRERAGLRYQRRGLNEHGHVANFVETEQIISFERADATHYASFVQTRGSIPVFWSQSPYNLHPIPTLERSDAENEIAFEKHFADQVARYGHQIAVNLTELHGREGIITAEYRNRVENLAETDIKYLEFDFHRETRGMKYENISKLIKNLLRDFDQTLYFWLATPNQEYCRQNGTFRTNCMDCLDRTNVVQSAFGRHVLNQQLMRFGISEFPDRGIRYYEHFETIFNHAWANNGDMISREYAGTSALKGDFTRTGKRNITGMVNDASNSLARMYQNTVRDFWRQATIDYILGYHKLEIFRVVPQSTLMSAEPGVEIRWQKVRANASELPAVLLFLMVRRRLMGGRYSRLWSPIPNEARFSKRRFSCLQRKQSTSVAFITAWRRWCNLSGLDCKQ